MVRGILFLSLFFSLAEAKVFRNAYVSFEMPDSWDCKLEHTEWVCRNNLIDHSREAIIILTAKEIGPTDSFEAYKTHLAQPLQPGFKGAGQGLSQVKYQPKEVFINDQRWIDGLHMGSEVAGYFTRYLATIKDRIAILITFSAHKNHYTKYSTDFFKSVQSLRIIATAKSIINAEGMRPSDGTLGPPISSSLPPGVLEPGAAGAEGKGGSGRTRALFFVLSILLAAVAGYIFWKSRKR